MQNAEQAGSRWQVCQPAVHGSSAGEHDAPGARLGVHVALPVREQPRYGDSLLASLRPVIRLLWDTSDTNMPYCQCGKVFYLSGCQPAQGPAPANSFELITFSG